MKFLSRKGLAAIACSAAVATASLTAPAMAAETTDKAPITNSSELFAKDSGTTTTEGSSTDADSVKKFTEAVSAIIGMLTKIWEFVNKFLKF